MAPGIVFISIKTQPQSIRIRYTTPLSYRERKVEQSSMSPTEPP